MGKFTVNPVIFDGKNHGFRLRFSQQNQSIDPLIHGPFKHSNHWGLGSRGSETHAIFDEPVPFPDVTEKPRGRGREDGNWEDGFWAIGIGNN